MSQYGVHAFPTLMLFTKDGKSVKTIVGGMPLASLIQAMDDAKAASGG